MLFFVHYYSLFLKVLIRSTNIHVLVFPWSFSKSAVLFDRDCLIIYYSPSTKVLPPRYLLNTGGIYESGFGLNKGLQILWTVPRCVCAINILTLCCYTVYPCEFIETTFLNLESVSRPAFISLGKGRQHRSDRGIINSSHGL